MGINSLVEDAIGLAKENPVSTALGAGVIAAGAVVGGAALIGAVSKKKTRRTHTSRGWKLDRKKFNKSQKWEVSYRRRKAKLRRGKKGARRRGKVYYARKTGQPYILKANGQAKFIKGKRR